MVSLPDPLHPALVHFPIVLLLLGAAVALTACVFVYETARRGGELVYVHGVGVRAAPGQVFGNPPADRD